MRPTLLFLASILTACGGDRPSRSGPTPAASGLGPGSAATSPARLAQRGETSGSGGAAARAVEEVPPASADPAGRPSEPGRSIPMLDAAPFGCAVVPLLDGRLLRVLPDPGGERHVELEPGDALQYRSHARLEPSTEDLRVIGPDGACAPRLGEVRATYVIPDLTVVGQAFAGCGGELGSFAFAGCAIPAWLRYGRLEARIERLPARGPLADPMLEALEARAGFEVAATEDEDEASRRSRLRRRVRRSTLRAGSEELLVLELHHFVEGDDPCYADELVTTSVHLRRVDGPSPGPYEEIRLAGRVVGAYVDEVGRIVAFDTRRLTPRPHPCAADRQGIGFECDQMVLSSRDGVDLYVHEYFYGYNATFHDAMSLLYWRRDCDHTG